jgi:hypothetical protein
MCDCGNGYTDREKLNLPATGLLTEDDIKRAYRKCALKCHPDKNKTAADASAKFQIISNAYENLIRQGAPPSPPRWSPPPRSPRQKNARCPKGTRRNKKTGVCEDSNPRNNYQPPPPPPRQGQYPQQGKRCPKGTHKSRTTGMCLPNKPKHNYYAPPPPPPRSPPTPKTGKRCPNGTRKNKRTGFCDPK